MLVEMLVCWLQGGMTSQDGAVKAEVGERSGHERVSAAVSGVRSLDQRTEPFP